jgi:hypothetical protein
VVFIVEYAGWQIGNVFSTGSILSVVLEKITRGRDSSFTPEIVPEHLLNALAFS